MAPEPHAVPGIARAEVNPTSGPVGENDSRSLLGPTVVMAVGSIASRVLGFARNVVWAWVLGLNTVGAAYLVANTVPNIVFTLVAGGVLNAVFVPQLVRSMKRGGEEASAYADRMLTAAMILLALLTLAVTLAAPLLARLYAGGNWSSDDIALTAALAYWCLPQVFFYGVYTMLGQLLNARGSFGPMMWTPLLNNIVTIAVGLGFVAVGSVDRGSSDDATSSLSSVEIAVLGLGTTIGVAVQAIALVPVLRRNGYRFRPRFDFRGTGLSKAGHLATWSLLFVLVNQVAYWVVARVANTAGKAAGQVTEVAAGFPSYSNAYLIFLLPHGIVTVSVVTALLPRLSRVAADGDMRAVANQLSRSLTWIGLATVPAAALFLAVGPMLTRGAYFENPTADAAYIGYVLMAFAPGLVVFSAQHVVLRAFYALEDTRTPFLIQCGIAGCNVALVLAAGALLPAPWVVVGMAAGYSATYLFGVLLSVAVVRRRLGGLGERELLSAYGRVSAAALPPAAAAAAVSRWVANGLTGGLGVVLGMAVGGLVMLAGFAALTWLLRVPEARTMAVQIRRRMHG